MCLRILSEVGPTAQLSLSESLQSLQTSGCAFPFCSFLTSFPCYLGSDLCVTTELEENERSPTLETPRVGGAGLCWELGLSALPVIPLDRGHGGIGAYWELKPSWASPPAWTKNPPSSQPPLPFLYIKSNQWQGFLNQRCSCSFSSNYFFCS